VRRLEVVYRPAALADLQDIYRIVFRFSESHRTAAGFVERIMSRAPHWRRAAGRAAP